MTAGMHRWTLWLAVALMALTPLGAGCLEAAGATWDDVRSRAGFPPGEISAKSAKDEADAAARAWNADARLVRVATVEWRPRDAESGRGFNESGFPSDPELANGLATAWRFEYVTRNASFEVTVRADGSVHDEEIAAGDESEAYEAAAASPAWNVDSDAAIGKLRGHPEWEEGSRDAQMVINALALNGTESAWAFVALDHRWQGVVGLVDPETGAVEGVHRWNMSGWGGSASWNWSWSGGSWSWTGGGWNGSRPTFEDEYEGTLTRLEPQERHAFPVGAAGQTVRVAYRVENMPANAVAIRVLGPDGGDVRVRCDASTAGMGGDRVCTARAATAGEHSLVVALSSTGAYAEYEARLSVWHGEPPRGWSWGGD